MATYQEQQEAARLLGGELGMTAWLSSKRRQAEQEQAAAREAFDRGPEGGLLAAEEELAIAGAMATPAEWERAQRALGNIPIPPQPSRWELPPHLRQRVDDEKLAQLLSERRTDR